MAGDRKVTVILAGDSAGLKKAFHEGESAASGFGSKLGGVVKPFGDVAKIASGFVIGQGLMKLPGLMGGAIGAASDMAESLSKVNVVFGAGAKDIETWSATAAKSMGLSKGAALEAVGTFGNFLTAMGQTPAKAKDMSKSMVQLAADLGSFNNADPTEVLMALRSGLSGEAEPMKRFGVALNDAAVKAKAAQLGLGALGRELTEQEKIQARYAVIMEQTATAQGDFARTSDGAANQAKIMDARMADLSASIGEKLLPAKIKLQEFMLDKLIPAFEKFAEWAGPKIEAAFAFWQTEIQPRLEEFFAWLGPKLIEFGEWWSVEVQPRIEAFVAWLIPKLQQMGQWIETEFKKFQAYYESDIKPAMDNIEAAVRHVIDFIREHWPEIERIVKPVLEQVELFIRTTVTNIKLILGIIIDLLGGDWAGAWNKTKDLIFNVVDFYKQTLGNLLEFIRGLLPILRDLGEEMIDKIRYGAQAGASALADWFRALPGDILRWLGDAGSMLYQFGRDVVQGFFDGILGKLNDGKEFVKEKLDPRNWHSVPFPQLVYEGFYEVGSKGVVGFSDGALAMIDITTGLIKAEYQHLFYDLEEQAAEAGKAAGAAYSQNFGSIVGGFGGNVPGSTPVTPPGGGSATGGGFRPGMPIMNTPDGLFYHDGTGWKPMTGDAAMNPGTVQQPGGGSVSSPSLPPLPGGYEWQFVNGKWTPIYIGLEEPGSMHMDFGGGSYTGPGGHYTGASWGLVPNAPTQVSVNIYGDINASSPEQAKLAAGDLSYQLVNAARAQGLA